MQTTAEKIIKDSFSYAAGYRAPLRERRGEKLLHFLHEYIWSVPQKPWLDLGCSTGKTLAQAAEKELISRQGHVGIDISQSMIEYAHALHPELAEWLVADMEELPLADASVAGILSNSSLQWLANPILMTLPDQGVSEMRRVLSRGAPLAIVVPGRSLPSPFLLAYEKIYRDHPAWHGRIPFLPDPFSDFEIADLLKLIERNGFLTLFAETAYETIAYDNAEAYLEEIASSSRGLLLAPFQAAQKEKAWEEISEEFLEEAESGEYLHHSLAIYLVARAI